MSKTVPAGQAAADTDFFRAFAGRVRAELADNTREGDSTGVSALPATFEAANAHDNHPWCMVTDPAADCQGREIGLPSPEGHGLNLLAAHFFHDAEDGETGILYDRGGDDWTRITSGQLRTETATVRAHLVRLDALADQWDAVREAAAIRNAEAYIAEHGATPEQAAAMAEVKRIVGEPVPYVVPTEVEEAERITLAGARGAILNAYVWTPMDEPATAARLSVYAEPNEDDELDLAGARDLRAQLAEFLPKLDAMIAVLAEQDGTR